MREGDWSVQASARWNRELAHLVETAIRETGLPVSIEGQSPDAVACARSRGFGFALVAFPMARFTSLSPRQQRVALLIARGLTNKEVASRLGISSQTVAQHLKAIYRLWGVSTRAAVARWAWILELIESEVERERERES